MILVTGSVLARPETFDEILAACLAHVQRSRLEPGCVAHNVHYDAENALRLVFVEEWADRAALLTHFAVPESRAFAKSIRAFAAEPPILKIYDATPVQFG
ncbi:MAG: antibiotic biosynthesis monooxygenase [Blastocatellia bacterium]|nr:antibiotic biosynthesis monooxygenase [Blastocatellia bacterium]